jgi:hypothetical protein
MKARLCALSIAAAIATGGSAMATVAHSYAIVIGYNGLPVGLEGDALEPLQYADDDAASVHQLLTELGARSFLLTTFDAASQRRFAPLVPLARPPTLVELRGVVADLRQALVDAGEARSTVLFFYSGHGSRSNVGDTLTLADGPLSQQVLYDEVLARLPATIVHVVVDACHADAVVRSRDAQAQVVDVGERAIASWTKEHTLARFPHVGAIVASADNAESHEWEVYQGGIFTHELISGLRGAADIDGDGRIEYSEMGAFFAAANRAVSDPRARLRTVIVPPRVNPRSAIVDRSTGARDGRLRGRPARLGPFYVEDADGHRLVDVHAEAGARVDLLLPTDSPLFLRTAESEAEVQLRPGDVSAFEALQMSRRAVHSRGAIDSSLRRGLFATPFGPAYYRGYIDDAPTLPSVEVSLRDRDEASDDGLTGPAAKTSGSRTAAKWTALATTGGLAVTSAWFGKVALDAHQQYEGPTVVERQAPAIATRYRRDGALALAFAAGALVAAGISYIFWR